MAVNTLTDAQLKQVVKLYLAYFNRAPETSGLDFHVTEILKALNATPPKTFDQALSARADQFFQAAIAVPEFSGYSVSQPVTDFVRTIYGNVLLRPTGGGAGGPEPSASDVNFWANKILTGQITRGELVTEFLKAVDFLKANGTSAEKAIANQVDTVINNRVTVAIEFAKPANSGDLSGEAAFKAGQAILENVDGTAASVTAAIASLASNNGDIFTLTTSTDGPVGFEGTKLADTFNAPVQGPFGQTETLTAFDNLDGKDGVDTLNIFSDGNFTIPLVTVKNIENVNIAVAQDVVAGDMSTWTGVQNLTITAGDDVRGVITGATGTVTVNGKDDVDFVANSAKTVVVKSDSDGETFTISAKAAETVTITNTGSSDINLTVGSPATVTVTTGDDFAGDDDVTVNGTSIGKLVITNPDDVNVNVTTAKDITITGANQVGFSQINLNVANLDKVALKDLSDGNAANNIIRFDTSTETVNLTVNMVDDGAAGLDQDDLVDVSNAGAGAIKALNVELTGNANFDFDLQAMKALKLTGAGDLGTADLHADATGNAALTSVTSTTTGAVFLDVDAKNGLSVSTGQGGDYINVVSQIGGTSEKISTGTGSDTVDLSNGTGSLSGTGWRADGGAGDFDTLRISEAGIVAPGPASDHNVNVVNFEHISVVGALGATGSKTLDTRDFSGAGGPAAPQTVTLEDDYVNGTTLLGLNKGATVNLEGGGQGAGTVLTVTLNDPSSGSDSLNVNITNGGVYEINTPGIETLNVGLDGDQTTNLFGNTGDKSTTTLNITNLTGDEGGSFTLETNFFNTVHTLDASTVGDVDITANLASPNTGPLTVKTSAGDDDITGSDAVDNISLGDGADTVTGGLKGDKIDLGADSVKDTVIYNDVVESQGVNVDTISKFGSQDVIDLRTVVTNFSTTGAGNYLGEASGVLAVLTAFTAGGDTEAVLDSTSGTLYIDANGDGSINNSDMVVNLTGVVDLSSSNFQFV